MPAIAMISVEVVALAMDTAQAWSSAAVSTDAQSASLACSAPASSGAIR
ncbi:MAG: hypothetical protein ACREU3_16245 [Steroidobacteraceae bacterium]